MTGAVVGLTRDHGPGSGVGVDALKIDRHGRILGEHETAGAIC